MAERLTLIRDRKELQRALEAIPDPDSLPDDVPADQHVVWRNYCRYYRKRMRMIADDFTRKGEAEHRSPRSFESFCEALGKGRKSPPPLSQELVSPETRGFKKAVLPERGTAKSTGGPSGVVLLEPEEERHSPDVAVAEEASRPGPEIAEKVARVDTVVEKKDEVEPAVEPGAPSPFATMDTAQILEQVEKDVDQVLRVTPPSDPPIAATLAYSENVVPAEMRPILKEYGEQYATSKWQRQLRVIFS